MTPLLFEQRYRAEWDELERLLAALNADGGLRHASRDGAGAGTGHGGVVGAGDATGTGSEASNSAGASAIVRLYRRCCEHLALARSRGYPAALVDRLEFLTGSAHQFIYQRREWGWWRLRGFLAAAFPRAVRTSRSAVWLALATFMVPALVLGPLIYRQPDLIYSVMNAESVAELQQMYSIDAESLGRLRTAETDWSMFGYYIRHNIGIAFECFASGLFVGLGSLLALGFNGVILGAVAGYLTARGLGANFWPFVATHSAFELTAIVLSGAAGIRMGAALASPGRQRRVAALVSAVREAVPVVYGVTLMLVVAAAIEAFWSSSVWLPSSVKLVAATVCWLAVLSYLVLQGRHDS